MTVKNHGQGNEPEVWFEFVGSDMTDEDWLDHGPAGLVRVSDESTEAATVWVMLGTVHYVGIADAEHDLDVTIGIDDATGRVVAESVTIHRRPGSGARPIGSRSVAELHVGSYTEHALKAVVLETDGHGLPWDRKRASDEVAARLTRREASPGAGFARYDDDELRFVVEHYRKSSNRRRYRDLRAAYAKSRRFDVPDSDEALRRRVSEARKRIDPTTGRAFLEPVENRRA